MKLGDKNIIQGLTPIVRLRDWVPLRRSCILTSKGSNIACIHWDPQDEREADGMFFPFYPVSYSGWEWPSNKTIIHSTLWIFTDVYRYPFSSIPLHPSPESQHLPPPPPTTWHWPQSTSMNSEVNALFITLGSVGKVPKCRKVSSFPGCLSAVTEGVRATSVSAQLLGNLLWVRYPVSYLNLGQCQALIKQGPCLWIPSLNSSVTFLVFAEGKTALVCGLGSSQNLRIGHGEPEIERWDSLEKMEKANSKISLEYFFYYVSFLWEKIN